MDEEYDVVICGTGLAECILSGLLSQEKKKVLHIDRNSFYGGDGASLNITAMWKKFRNGQEPPKELGANREWNIDLIPKFVMANGQLVRILLKTGVSNYLEWKPIDGTYVYQMKKAGFFSKGGGTILKVPATNSEILKSDLMGLMEKRRCKNFMEYINNWDPKNPKTHQGVDVMKDPFSVLVKKFGLETNTVDFIGHAVSLYISDDFLDQPCIQTVEKIRLYLDSIGRYGDSPFIYPIYGLGGIPEGFSRKCAIFGGTFMLNKDIDKVLFDEDGKVCGVQSGEEVAKCKMLICDPSYTNRCGLGNKTKCVGKVIRSIVITTTPIPNTKDIPSVQIILPQRQTGRKSDIYVMMISNIHAACKKGYYVNIVSALIETNNPEKELEPAFELLPNYVEKFTTIHEIYEPVTDFSDNVFISKSMDQTSHFENVTENVLYLYKKITGKDLDLTVLPDDE